MKILGVGGAFLREVMRCERFWGQPHGWWDGLPPDKQAIVIADYRLCEDKDAAERHHKDAGRP